ncbi:hypothetical protein CDL12_00077 [Handroanthus impetiginosus]|uniref:Uncharacterized protein n=1 Tax=Handroanthus impetiginosus TaxID=429701 RepID=A0A2G9IBN0_9LAMI|nr:hypothetical protein CDL12_00077 [Handroanthus impetiginosus]
MLKIEQRVSAISTAVAQFPYKVGAQPVEALPLHISSYGPGIFSPNLKQISAILLTREISCSTALPISPCGKIYFYRHNTFHCRVISSSPADSVVLLMELVYAPTNINFIDFFSMQFPTFHQFFFYPVSKSSLSTFLEACSPCELDWHLIVIIAGEWSGT